MKKNSKELILNIIKVAVALTIVIIAIVNYDTLSKLDVRELIASASSIYIAAAIILGVYFVKAILLVLPASLIYISVGLALDTKTALLINMLGIIIEVTATYFLGKFLGKSAVEKKLRGTKGGDKLLSMKDKNKNTATLIIRFIPAFPIDFSSLFMGAFDFKFLPYFICSVIGLAPRVIGFTILGDGLYEILKIVPPKYIAIAVAVIVPIVAAVLIIRKKTKKEKTENQA